MRLPSAAQLVLLLAAAGPGLASSLTLYLPAAAKASPLAAGTHATLSRRGAHRTAALSTGHSFVFRNLSAGSYLADIHCLSDAFLPLRVDLGPDGSVAAWETFRGNEWENKGEQLPLLHRDSDAAGFEARYAGKKLYYVERASCEFACLADLRELPSAPACGEFSDHWLAAPVSLLGILQNPMILMGLASMLILFGLPYLMDNSEPAPHPPANPRL